MKLKLMFSLILVLLLSACASTKMTLKSDQTMAAPGSDMAQVIFMRHSFVGSAIQASIFDATSGQPEFIGILSNEYKLAYEVQPGEHLFMVVSEAADFMKADLLGGKTYFAMVTPRMGAWKARFSMHPVRNGGPGEYQYSSEEFQDWLKDSNFVANSPESEAWYRDNLQSIRSKQADYWPKWQEKSDSDKRERTLNPDDGI